MASLLDRFFMLIALAKYNRAGELLRQADLTYPAIVEQIARSSVERRADDGRPGMETKPWDPVVSADVMAIFDPATETATRLGHGRPGTDHVLSALLADHNGLCARLLKDLGVNVTTLRSQLPSA